MTDGFLPVYKPFGMSSFDVIRQVKRAPGFSGKVGHAGTLDVFACGVLILLLGKATREFDLFQNFTKTYRAGARLDYLSDTLDVAGELAHQPLERETRVKWDDINAVLPQFLGEQQQTIPNYSATKVAGKTRYSLAREGVVTPEVSKLVTISRLELVASRFPLVTLDVECSSGTYVRQLTSDIFASMGFASFLYALERRAIGPITFQDCIQMEGLRDETWTQAIRPIESITHP